MRTPFLLLAVALTVPFTAPAQTATRPAGIEQFDVAGLPKTATTPEERQIFLMLQHHKRGDLRDATRIHMMLAEYYKALGDRTRAADCAKQAADAWEAAEKGIRVSADPPGTPPFETTGLFRQNFGYADDVGVNHRWEFFPDGSWAHTIATPRIPDAQPLTELGWYAVADGTIRLWQLEPATDRTIPFSLLGRDGKDGAVLDGVKMKAVK
jgi:hypothetical protein